MNQWVKNKQGFTIVELLIVVVVIAILAAITIVAYGGITNRANDSTVQADLKTLATRVESYKVTDANENYPTTSAHLETVGFKASVGAYITTGNNLLYCRVADGKKWIAIAVSKSGKAFSVGSDTSLGAYTGPGQVATGLASQSTICPTVVTGGVTTGNPWGHTGGNWSVWAGNTT